VRSYAATCRRDWGERGVITAAEWVSSPAVTVLAVAAPIVAPWSTTRKAYGAITAHRTAARPALAVEGGAATICADRPCRRRVP
jgi:hypothetical protein